MFLALEDSVLFGLHRVKLERGDVCKREKKTEPVKRVWY